MPSAATWLARATPPQRPRPFSTGRSRPVPRVPRRVDEAAAGGREVLRLAKTADRSLNLVHACSALGSVHLLKGEFNDAVVVLERGLQLSRWRAFALPFRRSPRRSGRRMWAMGGSSKAWPSLKRRWVPTHPRASLRPGRAHESRLGVPPRRATGRGKRGRRASPRPCARAPRSGRGRLRAPASGRDRIDVRPRGCGGGPGVVSGGTRYCPGAWDEAASGGLFYLELGGSMGI